MSDSEAVWERYSRQILFTPFGRRGQQRLRAAHVAIVGCGALGSAQALLLTRAGVGRLTLIDRDFVEPSNLQRQNLFDEQDAAEGRPKATAAATHLTCMNREVALNPVIADLTPANIHQLLAPADIVLDGCDNFETRYLINDWSIEQARPWIYGAVVGAYGVTLNVLPGGPCLECVLGAMPTAPQATCDTAGVLNWVVNLVASLQVGEAVKYIAANATGAPPEESGLSTLRNTIWAADVWVNHFQQVPLPDRDPQCRACAQRDFVHLRAELRPHITLCGRDSVQIHEQHRQLDLSRLHQLLASQGRVRSTAMMLKFWTGPYELTVFSDGRAIVKGTTEPSVARSLYARYISA